jgi:hypothetical protein
MELFLTQGYIQLDGVLLDQEKQAALVEALNRDIDRTTYSGNNILFDFPLLQEVANHERLLGAVHSLLGEDCVLQPHRFCHITESGRGLQPLHRDSYYGHQKIRSLHTWELIVFYFPHDATLEMGPTTIVPGSQYDLECPSPAVERCVAVKAGTAMVVNYGMWHRGTHNSSNYERAMVKLQYVRLTPPRAERPSWNHQREHQPPLKVGSREWRILMWHMGWPEAAAQRVAEEARGVDADVNCLRDEREWDPRFAEGRWADFLVRSPLRLCPGFAAAERLGLASPSTVRGEVEQRLAELIQTAPLESSSTATLWEKTIPIFAAFACGPHVGHSKLLREAFLSRLESVLSLLEEGNQTPWLEVFAWTMAEGLRNSEKDPRVEKILARCCALKPTLELNQLRFTAALSLSNQVPLAEETIPVLEWLETNYERRFCRYSRAFASVARLRSEAALSRPQAKESWSVEAMARMTTAECPLSRPPNRCY